MPKRFLKLKVTESVAEIDLCSEPSNILDFEFMDELSSAIERASKCARFILCSSLNHFSLGVDIKIHTPEKAPQMLESFHSIIRKIYDFPGVTACFLHGFALGGGLELALPCDFIFAHAETNLGFPEIRLACFPPVATTLLPRTIGRKANALVLLGETIPAKQAQSIGLVDSIFEKENDFREEFKRKVCSHSSDALRIAKQALRTAAGFDFHQELKNAERIYLEDLIRIPDAAEGIQAFLEKRPPQYR